jgi:hypothetical protein
VPPGCDEQEILELMNGMGGSVFKFLCLLAKRIKDSQWEYLVFWKGYDITDSTWELPKDIYSDACSERHDDLPDMTGRTDESIARELQLIRKFMNLPAVDTLLCRKRHESEDSESDEESINESLEFDVEDSADLIEDLFAQYSIPETAMRKDIKNLPLKPKRKNGMKVYAPTSDGYSYKGVLPKPKRQHVDAKSLEPTSSKPKDGSHDGKNMKKLQSVDGDSKLERKNIVPIRVPMKKRDVEIQSWRV